MTQIKYIPDHYLAFVLSEQSRNELIELVPPSFGRVICHHVTIAFRFNEDLFKEIMNVIGEQPTVRVIAHLKGEHIECFEVEVNDAHRLELNGQRYHVTHSLEAPAKPVDSSKLLNGDWEIKDSLYFPAGIVLQGTVEMVRK